jgi:hypothetical protein
MFTLLSFHVIVLHEYRWVVNAIEEVSFVGGPLLIAHETRLSIFGNIQKLRY